MKKINDTLLADESRRKFIRGFSLLVGGSATAVLLSGNAISVAMAYSPNNDSTLTDGKIFTQAQMIQLKQICSIVIPKTETLGAAEVDTHGFIDNQLFHCHSKIEQDQAVEILVIIENEANTHFLLPFVELTFDQKFELLNNLDQGKGRFDQTQRKLFKQLKEYICFGYYTSEVGASKELRYDAVPGGFKGSIPYKDSDASWGSKGLFY
jgi:hypothetical protein